MALRFLLLGLVASLGFDLPSGQDVSSWTRAGRDWVDARMVDFSGPSDQAEPTSATPAPIGVASTRADLTFDAVVEGMAADFSADLASIEKARPIVEALAVESDEPPPAPAIEPASRVEKIQSAVRLTRQAVGAWASLIQPDTVQGTPMGWDDTL